MSCSGCRNALAEYVDGELTAVAAEAVRAHLDGCAACADELAGVRRALGHLREAGREQPPAALAGNVLAALAARSAPASGSPDDSARRGDAGAVRTLVAPRRFSAAFGWAAAAALVVAAGLVGYAVGLQRGETERLAELRADLSAQTGTIARLESDLRDRDGELVERSEALERSREEVRAARAELAGALERVLEREAATSQRVEALTEELAGQQRATAALESELDAARRNIARLRDEAEAARLAAAARDRPRGVTVAAAQAPRSEPVVFQRRGEGYELVVTGTRAEAVPRLLEIARDEGDRELASLALGALDGLLADWVEPEVRRRPDPETGGAWLLAVIADGFGGFAGETADGDEESERREESADGWALHRRRLEQLERAWRRASASEGAMQ